MMYGLPLSGDLATGELFSYGGAKPLKASEIELVDVSVDVAMRVNSIFHSVLPDTDKGNLLRNAEVAFYGFEFDGRLYGCAIWTTPVAQNRLSFKAIELRRMAIGPDAPKNTASRMLRLMRESLKRKFPHIKKAISYQAVDHHHGTIYKADNWTAAARTEFIDWTQGARKRAVAQTTSAKVRWEHDL